MAAMSLVQPSPQQSFTHMAPAHAAPDAGQVPNGHPYYNMGYPESNSQPASFNQPQSYPLPNYSRSFQDNYAARPAMPYEGKPIIYTALYSGVSVYEMEVHGVTCMRRRSDGWLNATQVLKVAGVDKGKRTKVLEKEILTGEHEKVQGGYGKYQGTWISYKRGREFCRQYGVEDILRPLLDYDVSSDGSGGQGQGQHETPTKEQAMAANRKRFYSGSGVNEAIRPNGPGTNGTFFSNISPTTSVALAAMNKAARLNSPAPRPSNLRRPSYSQQDGFQGGSQQSMMSEGSFDKYDSAYGTQPNGEPPRKRMRPDSQDGGMAPPGIPLDASMYSVEPTEPNESFVYDGAMMPQEMTNGNGEPIALTPCPNPSNDDQQDKLNLILDLFAEAGRTDYSTHPAFVQLSGEDLNIPLDASANNALHWAATLAKVPLLKLLIQKGANIYRGNAAGQSPLISAVLVNNCWEQSCFPELLELLGPLIEIRDIQGRTILHHVAVSSGIKGRAPSSKYYLEALLEFLVRIGTQSNLAVGASAAQTAAAAAANLQDLVSSQDSATGLAPAGIAQSGKGSVTLLRFLSHVVNARDKAGNTALNLVARVGNRSIIQQLIEIHADPALPNYKGVSAKDFGVGIDNPAGEQPYVNGIQASQGQLSNTQETIAIEGESSLDAAAAVSQVEDIGQDVISSMTAMLGQSLASHKDMLRARTEQIDSLNAQIQGFSAQQKQELDRLQEAKERVSLKSERQAKIANLKRNIADIQQRARARKQPFTADVFPLWLENEESHHLVFSDPSQWQFTSERLPDAQKIRTLLNSYTQQNNLLRTQADELKSRSSQLEHMYRKVVSLCTGVAESKVEASLSSLVAAVESERGALGVPEVGRVREFLRRVDGSVGVGTALPGIESHVL